MNHSYYEPYALFKVAKLSLSMTGAFCDFSDEQGPFEDVDGTGEL